MGERVAGIGDSDGADGGGGGATGFIAGNGRLGWGRVGCVRGAGVLALGMLRREMEEV